MSGGQRVWMSLGVWLGLGVCCAQAIAQPVPSMVRGPQFPSADERDLNSSARFYFGVMGQVARPGVYELQNPEPELVEILRHAGGMTRQASGRLRIVREGNAGQVVVYSPTLYFPLISGDIIVAEAARSQAAETLRHVAFLNVLDRPVILPVPDRHANIPAIVAYLGQHRAIATTVKIQPVGAGPAAKPFGVPTVLYFEPPLLERHRLPELPGVFRIGAGGEILPPTPNASADRFPRAEISAQPVSSAQVSEPIGQQEFRSRDAITPPDGEEASTDSLTNNEESEPKSTSWWTWAGLVLLVLLPVGAVSRRRWRGTLPESCAAVESAKTLPLPAASSVPSESPIRKIQPPAQAPAMIGEEALEALLFNRLPVFEETAEPAAPEPQEEQPKPRKRFRLDPPEEQSAAVKPPYLSKPAKRPGAATTDRPEAPPTVPLPRKMQLADRTPPTPSEENRPGPGLLDRVLKRVHQNRAA